MARKTIKGLEEIIEELENKLNEYKEIIDDRNKQIEKMENVAEEGFNNSPTYKQMDKKIKHLKTVIEGHKITIKNKEATIKVNDNAIKILKEEVEKLKANSVQKIKNERGAGRKSKINDDIIRTVYMLKLQNKSVRAISEEIGLSVGTVQKIITEHINLDN